VEQLLGHGEEKRVKERTVQLGGETLGKGSTVVVFTGRGHEEHEVTRVGTKRIYLVQYGREDPFSLESRTQIGSTAGYVPYFKTHTEVAAMRRRQELMLKLREYGLQSVDGSLRDLSQYPEEALEEVLAVLSKHRNSKN
jgi:hypothetical protein